MKKGKVPSIKGWPADKVERRAISTLVPYASNSRTHSDEQIKQIVASIREWGWTTPVLVDEAGGIIAGHARVMAAKQLGLTEVPVMVAAGWSEAQKKAYVIADNKLTLNGGWDDEILRAEFTALDGLGFDLGMLGFSPPELAAIRDVRAVGLTDPDDAPEPSSNPVATRGDLWALGRHWLLCGDATSADDTQKVLGGVKPHLLVSDPPYGVDYKPEWRAKAGLNKNKAKMGLVSNDDRADWRDAWALFPGDVGYIWHGALHAATVAASLESSGFGVRSQIIWAKDRFAMSRGDYHWQHEPCWYVVRTKATGHWVADRKQTTLWQIKSREDGGHGHSTQKPVECMKRPIENNSSPGQAVYEPFSGSGTTIIAAEMTGRSCHAIELDPAYVDVAITRWQNFTGLDATLDGKTFNELRTERQSRAA